MRMKYLGDPDAMHPPVLTGPDGEQVPMRDLTREEGIQYRDVIHANEQATGTTLFEPIHEPKDEPDDTPKDRKPAAPAKE
jgi:hypothetical protein